MKNHTTILAQTQNIIQMNHQHHQQYSTIIANIDVDEKVYILKTENRRRCEFSHGFHRKQHENKRTIGIIMKPKKKKIRYLSFLLSQAFLLCAATSSNLCFLCYNGISIIATAAPWTVNMTSSIWLSRKTDKYDR